MKKDTFERAKASSDQGVLVHLVCNEADALFYSEDPEALTDPHRTVLCVETFFGAMCEGGFAAWFELDHGPLAHCGPGSLRAVGLTQYAELAQRALRLHDSDPLPATIGGWSGQVEKIRRRHEEEDHSEIYQPLDTEFFLLCQEQPGEFRQSLFDYILRHEQELLTARDIAAV